MSAKSSVKYLLLTIGIAILAFGFFIAANYVFRMNSDRERGTNALLYDLGFVAFGVSLELLGLGDCPWEKMKRGFLIRDFSFWVPALEC